MFLVDKNEDLENRKRSSKKVNNYFDVKEEQAVVEYINAETKYEKNKEKQRIRT